MACAENQAIEIKAVVQPGQRPGQREDKKMLKMKVDPNISMKTKDGETRLFTLQTHSPVIH